jgi:DNA-binding NtrC family response regulator
MPTPRPQLVLFDPDGWVGRQLAELAAENRWRVRPARTPAAALAHARERRPTLVVVRIDPAAEDTSPVALVADVHRVAPDAAVVAVSDEKLSEHDRAAWTAVLFDLGARFVLFPPLSKAVLEDVASGLMAAAAGAAPPPAAAGEEVIDLADEDDG